MKKILFLILFFINIVHLSTAQKVNKSFIKEALSFSHQRAQLLLKNMGEYKSSPSADAEVVSPRTVTKDGKLKLVRPEDWTSGFFPGELWYLYQYSKDDHILAQAKKLTSKLEQQKFDTNSHDVGFEIYNSYGNGYRITKDPAYKNIIIQAAKSLSTRFNPTVGAIRSWDFNSDEWKYPVIIDNMMNLELLFAATKLSADSTYYNIAVQHANTTMINHFRSDYSSWHVVDYDPQTGKVRKKVTHQGYSDSSAWARGQAWALYGYTMCYRETHNKTYLQQAEHIAHFILTNPNLPDDLIPYWDFDAPQIRDEPKDASAAAVAASALYELSNYSQNADFYISKADTMIYNLYKNYTTKDRQGKGFILQHSTGFKPANSEVNVPLIYADYYFVEALMRKKKLLAGSSADL